MAVTANEGADIAGEPIIISQLAINGRSHEGVDIAGERIFSVQRAISGHSQRGRRHHKRANHLISQLAIRGRSHEGVDIAGEQSGGSAQCHDRSPGVQWVPAP